MTSIGDTALPHPQDWQKFERECRSIWQRIWNDPNTQLNGRSGQRQAGVDFFGRQDGVGPWKGVQCKGRNAEYGSALTEDELRAEVNKAKTFKPPLSEFTIATSARVDEKIQEVARLITEENAKVGLFSVHVYGWDAIRQKIAQYPDVLDEHRPGFGPSIRKISENTKLISERVDDIPGKIQEMFQEFLAAQQKATSPVMAPSIDAADEFLNDSIDGFRDIMKSGQPRTALRLLEGFKAKRWETATANVRFRIDTNIAAAKLLLGNSEEAAAGFLAAAEYKPGDETADCNIALAHHLLGNQAEFLTAARGAAEAHPASTRAWSLAIAASCDDPDVSDPAALVSEKMLDDDEVLFAIAHWHRRRGNHAEYMTWMRKAYETDPDQMEVMVSYAASLLGSLIDDKAAAVFGRLGGARRRRLDEAVAVLSKAWNAVKGGEAAERWVEAAVNLGSALRMQGNVADAEVVASEAMAIAPNNPEVLRLSAMAAIANSNWDAAIHNLSKLPEDGPAPQRLTLADAYLEAKRYDEARTVLDQLLANSDDHDARVSAREMKVHLLAATEGHRAAADEALAAVQEGAEPLLFRAIAADQLRLAGEEREALSIALAAASELDERTSIQERIAVGDVLRSLGRLADATSAYEPALSYDIDTPSLRWHLWCLLDLDRRMALREAIDRLDPDVRALPEYRLIDAAYHERAGDLHAAADKLGSYLQAEPKDFPNRLSWIAILERLGDQERLNAILSREFDIEGASGGYLMRLAHVLDRNGFSDKALDLAYRAVRTHPGEEEVCASYAALLMFRCNKQLDPPEEVGLDTAVTLEDAGGRQQTYVIESGDILDPHVEVPPFSNLAERVRGLKVGETVALTETEFLRDERKIVAVRHKMLYRLGEVMERFNTRFPGSRAMMKVDIRRKDGKGFDLTPILTSLDARQEWVLEVEDMYRDGSLTIGFVAPLLGVHPVDAWLGLATLNRVSIKCCAGNAEEQEQAFRLLAQSPDGFVVDPVTLYAMHSFNIKDDVLATIGRLAVTRSAIDCLQQLLELRRMDARDGRREMAKVGDQYFRYEVPKEVVERDVHSISSLIEWTGSHCDLLPAVCARELPLIGRQLVELWDRAFTDTVLAASGSGRPLLSDDFLYRSVAKRFLDVDGIWLQPVLMDALRRNILDQPRYYETIEAMVLMNHGFISINAEVLGHAFGRWRLDERFRRIAGALGYKDIFLSSSVTAAVEFLSRIWSMRNLDLDEKRGLTFAMLRGVIAEHHFSVATEIINEFRQRSRGFKSLGGLFHQSLDDWSFGHFLHIGAKAK